MLKAKNWESFQSYKDRCPPWIRLHRRLLDDFSFQKMTVDARALLPMLWLLISEDEDPVTGLLRIGYEEIAFRLRMDSKTVKMTIEEIIRAGFLERIEPDEKDLFGEEIPIKTKCYGTVTKSLRNCHPETETETETETDKKKFNKKENLKGNTRYETKSQRADAALERALKKVRNGEGSTGQPIAIAYKAEL